ncbi:MAG: methyltransferase domain-containing protein [Candidatus Thorarchaeota archaeon]
MIEEFQDLFVCPEDQKPLRYTGSFSSESRWTNGVLEDGVSYAIKVTEGIPEFIKVEKKAWTGGGDSFVPDLELIEDNWNRSFENLRENRDHPYYHHAREIAEHGGLGIDIASGPGGGAVPSILFFDPDARVLMTDLGVLVLRLWQEHLSSFKEGHNVSFAEMDVTRIPLKSGCLDYVVDSGGFGNVEYADRAICESFRILRSGGRLYLNNAITEGIEELPTHVYLELVGKKPHDERGWESVIEEAGFEIERVETWNRRRVEYEESDLGALAKEHGVDIYFTSVSLIGQRP